MIKIAHRGNLHGPNPLRENDPVYIEDALKVVGHCEVDVWLHDWTWWTGHDKPQYPITREFLDLPGLWIHAKSPDTFLFLQMYCPKVNYFWHDVDEITFTSKGNGWTCNDTFAFHKNVLMIPDIHWKEVDLNKSYYWLGVCNDWIAEDELHDPYTEWAVS